MNCGSIGFKVNIMNNSSVGCDQVEDENILTDEITDRALEAAASGPTVTLTLSIVLFACQFCPSDRAFRIIHETRSRWSNPSAACPKTASLTGLDTTCYALPRGSATNRVASPIFRRIKT